MLTDARDTEPSPSAVVDQNVLFGVLAVQLDFITKEALLAAVNVWLLTKGRPLGSILQLQGALDRHHHDLLTSLVTAHLHKHGNDPRKCLAALGPLGALRRELAA